MSVRGIGIALAATVLSVAGLVAACSSSGPTCDCADPAITISIPTDVAASVTASQIQISGTACTGVQVTCTNQTGGCSEYQFTANAVGMCHVVVPVGDTTFAADVKVEQASGCCTGFFASPPSAGTITVPEPAETEDGGTD